jgi:tRNA threonylcarbamoyladenosine biosynthesis protein TsaE
MIYNLEEISEVARNLSKEFRHSGVWCFIGEMGAGKTTLIKAICREWGVEGEMSSPTFSIVNQYQAQERTIYHFDFYRLRNLQEALDIGVEEYFFSGDYCLIEWPQQIESLLPDQYLEIHINLVDENKRSLTTRQYG